MGFRLGEITPGNPLTDREIKDLKYVVMHHTATRTGLNADEMYKSMYNTWIKNRGGSVVPTHYIIDYNGNTKKVNDWDINVYSVAKDKYNTNEQVKNANRYGIHIEVVGDFNKHKPSKAQYEAINVLLGHIKDRTKKEGLEKLEILTHSDFQSKTCPGELFDFDKIGYGRGGEYKLSRYYSVMPNQRRYYNNKTYEEDFAMNCMGDCLSAGGIDLRKKTPRKVVACPPEMDKGTKFSMEGLDGIFECVDRGSAIKGKRLDVWCGIGDSALDNWKQCPTGTRNIFIIG